MEGRAKLDRHLTISIDTYPIEEKERSMMSTSMFLECCSGRYLKRPTADAPPIEYPCTTFIL